jgi:tetratricopeptide (TPR) repeat protein
MARTKLEVFLSSTAKDLAAHRIAVHDRLMRTGLFHCIWQEDFSAQNADAVEFCRRQAQKAELFVGLVGLRRGWEPKGDNAQRSITEMEHDWAKEAARRRYLWVTPDDFLVAGNLRESDDEHARQLGFRQRVMAAGERVVSQTGFDSPDLLASEIVEQLLVQVFTGDLITLLRPDLAHQDRSTIEDQKPAIAAAVERLAEDKDVDLLALAKNPKDIDLADLEAKLKVRANAHEAAGQSKIMEGKGDLKASAQYWRHIGALAFLHNTQKALAAYTKAVALDADEPDGWRYLGELQYRLGDTVAAERAFEALRTLGTKSGSKQSESMGYLRLGWIHRRHGNLAKAEEMQLKALKLNEELGSKEGMARAYGNLGNIYQSRGELTKAEEMHLKSLKLEGELGRKEGMAADYGNLGVIYRTRGELPKAEEMQLKALKLNEELGSKEGMARAYGNLGVIYGNRNELTKAEEMQLEALKLNEELGRKEGMAITYDNLGHIYAARKNKTRMCECWRRERDLWRDMGLTNEAAEVEQQLKLHGCEEN